MAASAESSGSSKVRLPGKYGNGLARASSAAAMAASSGHATPEEGHPGSCKCGEMLASFDPRFFMCNRTAREQQLLGSSSKRLQHEYNFSMLSALATELLFEIEATGSYTRRARGRTSTFLTRGRHGDIAGRSKRSSPISSARPRARLRAAPTLTCSSPTSAARTTACCHRCSNSRRALWSRYSRSRV